MHLRNLGAMTIASAVLAACVPGPNPPSSSTTTTAATTTTTAPTTTTTALPLVAITSSDPTSPSSSVTPRLSGIAPPATTTVRIFTAAGCGGPLVAGGNLAEFGSAGILVAVGLGSTTTFSALASGPGLSACSAPITYVNTLTAPTADEHEPNGTVADANPLTVDIGTPVDVQGQLDGPTGGVESDNFTFTVAAGRSIRIETFDWTGAGCDATDTRVYLYAPAGSTGGIDEDGGIGACSLIDPSADIYAAAVAGGEYRVLVIGTPAGGTYRLRIEILP